MNDNRQGYLTSEIIEQDIVQQNSRRAKVRLIHNLLIIGELVHLSCGILLVSLFKLVRDMIIFHCIFKWGKSSIVSLGIEDEQ